MHSDNRFDKRIFFRVNDLSQHNDLKNNFTNPSQNLNVKSPSKIEIPINTRYNRPCFALSNEEKFMSLIAEILPVQHIELDVEISSKKRLFEEIGALLEKESGLSGTHVFECLFQREKLGSTGLGQGVAIPHGRHASVKKAVGAFIRCKEPVAFDAADGKPVSLVFALLVPENATGEHLEVLSKLAGKFSSKSVREALMSAQTPEEVSAIFSAE